VRGSRPRREATGRTAPVSALGLVLLVSACAAAQEAPGSPSPVVAPELMARAGAEGLVRVIVGLRVPAAEAGNRRQAIESARERVLRDISQTPHRVVRTFDTVPFMALEASAEALRALAASPHVVSVQADTLAAPQSAPTRQP